MTLTALLAVVVIAGLLLGLVVLGIALVFWPLPDILDKWMLRSRNTIAIVAALSILTALACKIYDYNPQLWPAHNSPERVSERWQKDIDARAEKMRQALREEHGDALFEALFGGQHDINDR